MATPAAEASPTTPYRMKAREIAACNCRHGCNCQFAGYPNEGYCEFLFSFEIDEGDYGDVDLGGLAFVLALSYPNAIHEGDGRGVLFVDESATDEQADALVTILTGQAGGMPWEALGPTVTSLEGPIRAPVEIERSGRRSAVRVPDVLEMQLTPLKNPVTGEDNEVNIVYPKGGLFWEEGEIATTDVMWFSYDGFEFEHPRRYAETADVEYTNV